jgi:hypothetical protein
VRQVETPSEFEEVSRLRYDVYVSEMNLSMRHADHSRRSLSDPLDEFGVLLVALDAGRVVGSVRVNFAADGSLGEYEDLYRLPMFGAYYPAGISISTKLVVAADYRRSTLPLQLMCAGYRAMVARGALFDAIDCRPALVPLFKRVGYRQVAPSFVHPDDGIHVPLVLSIADLEFLRTLRSPFLRWATAAPNHEQPLTAFGQLLQRYSHLSSPN